MGTIALSKIICYLRHLTRRNFSPRSRRYCIRSAHNTIYCCIDCVGFQYLLACALLCVCERQQFVTNKKYNNSEKYYFIYYKANPLETYYTTTNTICAREHTHLTTTKNKDRTKRICP